MVHPLVVRGLMVYSIWWSQLHANTNVNIIDYVTIATIGDALDFGDLTNATRGNWSVQIQLEQLFAGGYTPNNTIY